MSLIPVGLEGEFLKAVVIGGGSVGTRRALALLDAGATVKIIAPSLQEELDNRARTDAKLSVERRDYAGSSDLAEANLVVAATNSRSVNDRVKCDAMSKGIGVNVADAGENGSVIFLAVHRAGPVTIGVSAGGVPKAAARIRDLIAVRIDTRYADAVTQCAEIRDRLINKGGTGEWHTAAADLIGEEFCASVEDGSFDERAARWR